MTNSKLVAALHAAHVARNNWDVAAQLYGAAAADTDKMPLEARVALRDSKSDHLTNTLAVIYRIEQLVEAELGQSGHELCFLNTAHAHQTPYTYIVFCPQGATSLCMVGVDLSLTWRVCWTSPQAHWPPEARYSSGPCLGLLLRNLGVAAPWQGDADAVGWSRVFAKYKATVRQG